MAKKPTTKTGKVTKKPTAAKATKKATKATKAPKKFIKKSGYSTK